MLSLRGRRSGFTLVELLVVLAILGVLIALLLPATQKVREAANRTRCQHHLRQIGLALHTYHDANSSFPPGGKTSPSGGYGFSWWVYLLPMLEQGNLDQQLDKTSRYTGWVGGDPWSGNVYNRNLLRDLDFDYMFCPSSPLPRKVLTSAEHNRANVMSPTYAGISGANDHPTARDKSLSGGAAGRLSWGGMLLTTRPLALRDVLDGTATTLLVAEQSDWCRDAAGQVKDCRSDCWHGFPMGPGNDGWERAFNLTTVLHRLNQKSSTALGVFGNCGPNSAIQSSHPGGANVLTCDGAVHFLLDGISVQALYNLSNRDDSHVTSLP